MRKFFLVLFIAVCSVNTVWADGGSCGFRKIQECEKGDRFLYVPGFDGCLKCVSKPNDTDCIGDTTVLAYGGYIGRQENTSDNNWHVYRCATKGTNRWMVGNTNPMCSDNELFLAGEQRTNRFPDTTSGTVLEGINGKSVLIGGRACLQSECKQGYRQVDKECLSNCATKEGNNLKPGDMAAIECNKSPDDIVGVLASGLKDTSHAILNDESMCYAICTYDGWNIILKDEKSCESGYTPNDNRKACIPVKTEVKQLAESVNAATNVSSTKKNETGNLVGAGLTNNIKTTTLSDEHKFNDIKTITLNVDLKKEQYKCPSDKLSEITKLKAKYVSYEDIVKEIDALFSYCIVSDQKQSLYFDAKYQSIMDMIKNVDDKIAAESEQVIADTVSSLKDRFGKMGLSAWKTTEGEFNKARLASDSIAGVVLGTAGGLITSKVVKKNQVKSGFEDIGCTIGDQRVADWSDEFTVGVQ